MRFYFQQAFRAIVLLMFAVFIIKLHYTGDIHKLINPKYDTISQIGAILFLVLFIAQLPRIWTPVQKSNNHLHVHDHTHDGADHNHDHGYSPINLKKLVSYCVLILPLVTGFMMPPSTLDSSIADKKGTMVSLTNSAKRNQLDRSKASAEPEVERPNQSERSVGDNQEKGALDSSPNINNKGQPSDNPQDPNLYSNTVTQDTYQQIIDQLKEVDTIEMTDQVYATYYEAINMDLAKFEGKEISINGFVYKEDGFAKNQLVVGRYLITHCVADASIIGFLSEFNGGVESISEDTWLEVTGTIHIKEYNGVELPTISVTESKEIEEPEQPYLYPLNIKIR
ncbi:TIGR03943 family putative permease subunit [Aquibacillus albus]|uniref:Membrane protein n=1 Tax=Aquibacillus albus TaxID=1168171 RepID=A0ABS2MYI7_9BACI|nr:TIGR03943 family protein [Aquibacillus albus]MBM7570863.1 putative membrane protein [Aquibacillus albus]